MQSLLGEMPDDDDATDPWKGIINPNYMTEPVFTEEQLAAVRALPGMAGLGVDLTQPPHDYLADFGVAMPHLDPASGAAGSQTANLSPSGSNDFSTAYVTGGPDGRISLDKPAAKVCPPVDTRVLQGNSDFIGKPGAWGPAVPITPNSAAIIRSEFDMNKGQLRPYVGQISGAINGQPLFNGVTDSIDNKTPPAGAPAGMSTPKAFEYLNPGDTILEVQGIPEDLGVQPVTFTVPQQVNCPVPPKSK